MCRHKDSWEGFVKYAFEMGTGAVIYILSFIKIDSGIKKMMVGAGYSQIHRQHGDRISLILFFQNKESRPINDYEDRQLC
jgi:hypothetical protein